jgi:hypothetical protein
MERIPLMSESSPFISIREFVFSLSDSTRRDLIVHLVMDRIGLGGLKDLSGSHPTEMNTETLYDRYFSEGAPEEFARRGAILALRASIDFHIWCFTSKYGIDEYKSFVSLLNDGPMNKDTVEMLADGWERRSVELQAAAVRWERLIEGSLSNREIHEYFVIARARPS